MEFVNQDKVATIIVKDMSRLGRDYLKVGYYTEILFPENEIRFIAINSGVIIHKAEKVDGHRQMKIDIFYNGIGKVNLPNEKV